MILSLIICANYAKKMQLLKIFIDVRNVTLMYVKIANQTIKN